MLRSLAVVIVSAVALSAEAQEASTPEGDEKPAPNVPASAAEGEQSQAVVASIEPAGSQRPQLSPSTPATRPDAGVEAGPREEATDCGIRQAMLRDDDPPVADRRYAPDLAEDRPAVSRAGRCFRKCIIQVKTQSKEPWVLRHARIEGPGGEVLKVIGIQSQPTAPNEIINVIEAERTEGPALASKMTLTLHLTAEDGRVALLEQALP